MRLHVHVGFRVKFAHHFAHEAVIHSVFHVGCHPPALSDLPVQAQNLGLGQRRNEAPVFVGVGSVQAIHLFPLPLRVVFNERRLTRAVQHLEQAVQWHGEPRHGSHDEVHRFYSALGVPQLIGVLPFGVHLIQQLDRIIVLNELGVNVRARFLQQFFSAFGQLFKRRNALFMQIRVIQFDLEGIRVGVRRQNIPCTTHVKLRCRGSVIQQHGFVVGFH